MAFQEFSKNCLSIFMEPLFQHYLFLSDLLFFVLKLNKSVAFAPLILTILPSLFTAGISLQYCHKLPDVFE